MASPADDSNAALLDWTAQKVMALFREDLRLPVCDDAAAIQASLDQQRPIFEHFQSDPDPIAQARADAWFKNTDLATNQRPALLQLVYEMFADLATTVLSAAQSRTLNLGLRETLKKLAYQQCCLDAALAEQFLDKFVKERGILSDAGPAMPPMRVGTVPKFEAKGRLGQIQLRWSTPVEGWDSVIIERSPAKSPEDDDAEPIEVYRGTENSFTDKGLPPGRHNYRAHAVFQGTRGPDSFSDAFCLGEARNGQAVWRDGRLHLSWEFPCEGLSAHVFRKINGSPSVKSGPHGPQAGDRDTKLIFAGRQQNCIDEEPSQGTEHCYRIVTVLDDGTCSSGVELRIEIPKRPPAVPSVIARHSGSSHADEVALHWEPVPSKQGLEYVVVRRDGNTPPASPADGTEILVTSELQCVDKKVQTGRRYAYAVFTRARGLCSPAAPAYPVDILSEVSKVQAIPGDGTVDLRWTAPAQARVIIRRGTPEAPRDHNDGTSVQPSGTGRAKDQGLCNGVRHHYRLHCAYRIDPQKEVISAGVLVSAVPGPLPDPVKDLRAVSEGEEIVCRFTPPSCGQVVVVRSGTPPKHPIGHRLPASDIDSLGERLFSETDMAVDSQPDSTKPYYAAFTVSEPHAVAGNSCMSYLRPDVSDLTLENTKNGIRVRWAWPTDCQSVVILRVAGRPPSSVNDSGADVVRLKCTRSEYSMQDNCFMDHMSGARGTFYYAVFARVAGISGEVYARGKGQVIQLSPPMTLRYTLDSAGGWKNGSMRIRWSIEEPFPEFEGFALWANYPEIPRPENQGERLWGVKPGKNLNAGEYEHTFDLSKLEKKNWKLFFCKLMPLNASQIDRMLIIHPNICIPFNEKGSPIPPKACPPPKSYRGVAPEKVICPSCFDEFPSSDIMFTSWENESPVRGVQSWADKIAHRPPQAPRDARGQVLARKVCPKEEHHDLPFTAGSQESLLIGLIGAKFSGKSHYVASLIKCLEGQVGSDLQAALMPVTEDTSNRYKQEFERPLWGDRMEIAMTVGTPPPLIYDLTLDGRLWGEDKNRSVTLALYDTAGENLDDRQTLARMVTYLQKVSGVMFLIDPLQSLNIRQQLPNTVQLPDLDRMADPSAIITRVIEQLKLSGAMVDNSLPTPVAVVLTKCDVLLQAGIIRPNSLWNTDRRHVGRYDLEAHNDVSGMIGELIKRFDRNAYQVVWDNFPNHAFFGVSATGCSVDAQTGRFKDISPRRVADPLLWLLSQLKVLPAGQGSRNA